MKYTMMLFLGLSLIVGCGQNRGLSSETGTNRLPVNSQTPSPINFDSTGDGSSTVPSAIGSNSASSGSQFDWNAVLQDIGRLISDESEAISNAIDQLAGLVTANRVDINRLARPRCQTVHHSGNSQQRYRCNKPNSHITQCRNLMMPSGQAMCETWINSDGAGPYCLTGGCVPPATQSYRVNLTCCSYD